ncbi:MAG TPA: hypothetical protein VGK33_21880 [Chloroflexota bacterium]
MWELVDWSALHTETAAHEITICGRPGLAQASQALCCPPAELPRETSVSVGAEAADHADRWPQMSVVWG